MPPMPPAGGPAEPFPATAAVLRSCLLTFFSPPALKPWMLSRSAELAGAGFAALGVAVGGGGAIAAAAAAAAAVAAAATLPMRRNLS